MQTPNRMTAMIVGYVLVLIGVLGFIPGIVSGGALLGIFGVSAIHNVIHLATGGILLAAAYMDAGRQARNTNLTLGIVYALVAVLGFLNVGFVATLLNSGADGFIFADAILHSLLAVTLVVVALAVHEHTPGTRGHAV